ncbi:MAG: hypothetical protein WAQ33_12265 [Gaiellaceae bacterium]
MPRFAALSAWTPPDAVAAPPRAPAQPAKSEEIRRARFRIAKRWSSARFLTLRTHASERP